MHLSIEGAAQGPCRVARTRHATGFAVAGVQPTCMIPEIQFYRPRADRPVQTPGTPEMGLKVAELVDKHNTV